MDLCIPRSTNSCCCFPSFKIFKPSLYFCTPLAFRNNSALCYCAEEQKKFFTVCLRELGLYSGGAVTNIVTDTTLSLNCPLPTNFSHAPSDQISPSSSCRTPPLPAQTSPRTLRAALLSQFEPQHADPCKHMNFPAPLLTVPYSHLGVVREEDFLRQPVWRDTNSN